MILYNVTYKVDHEVNEDWMRWMRRVYIPRVMDTGKFDEHKLCQIMGVDESDGMTYSLQLMSPNMITFQLFQEKDAYLLQKAHMTRYKDHYVSFATIMKVVG